MNWGLILLAWVLGRWASGRDLTTWGGPSSMPPAPPPPAPPPPAPPRPPRPRAPAPTTPASYPAPSIPPWPQAIPAGLPSWPGGWEPDEPVGAGVAHRAMILLPELWAYGAGTRKTENTDGRWITYVASPMPGGRRGVVAFRPRPDVVPTWGPPRADEGPSVRTSAETHEPGSRTLRDGYQGDDVFYLQGRLGVRPLTGIYDAATIAAVRAFQRSHPPLAEDGVTGPKTWRELLPPVTA